VTQTLLILEATHRVPFCSVEVEHVGIVADEAEAEGEGAKNRTAPIVAAAPTNDERTIVIVAVARQRQFKR